MQGKKTEIEVLKELYMAFSLLRLSRAGGNLYFFTLCIPYFLWIVIDK